MDELYKTFPAVQTLEANGFDVIDVSNDSSVFNVVSRATGATILRVGSYSELLELERGINYAMHKDVDSAWQRPIRETGWQIVRA